MHLLFLILNYKTYKDTIRLTKEICQEGHGDYYVLIVDNASPNESYSEMSSAFKSNPKVEVIQSSVNGGYAKGNNYGLKYAKKYNPEYVCIMNNDVHFTWNTIENLVSIYSKLESPAIISPIQYLPNGERAKFIEFRVPNLLYDLRMNTLFLKPKFQQYVSNTKWHNVQKVGYLPGALLFADYSIFERIGFFDECTFLFCEERFTGKMVQRMGLNNYVILDLSYVHEHSKTINNEASLKRQRQLIHEGRLKYYERYSRCPAFTKFILNFSFHFHEFELYVISALRNLK